MRILNEDELLAVAGGSHHWPTPDIPYPTVEPPPAPPPRDIPPPDPLPWPDPAPPPDNQHRRWW